MLSKYYRTIVWLIALIIILGLLVVIFTPRNESSNILPVTSSSTPPIVTPLTTVSQSDNNTTVHLAGDQKFILNLGALRWSIIFSPTGIIGRVSSTTDNVGQGIYEGFHAGTTTLHGTGAPICKPGEMCPDFMEAMTITFVVE